MALRIIDDDVMPSGKGVYGADDSLISEVEQEGILLALKVCKFSFQFFMQRCVSAHHSCSHRVGKAPFSGSLGIYLSDLRIVCKPKIVVECPCKDFLSLESHKAASYYQYNKSLHTYMGSDAVMITPQVEIIKDENGDLLPETVIVAVMTCAAPMLTYGMEGMTQDQYEAMMFGRITGMLNVAAYLGYQRLVLGAFGCGAFANNSRAVARAYKDALEEYGQYFSYIEFAVYCRPDETRNYDAFRDTFASQH